MGALITGGAGFIGSHLVEALLKRGEQIRVFDNFSTGKPENLAFVGGGDRLEVIRGDLRDLPAVREAMRGVEVVFHQAAIGSVVRSVEDPLATNETNVGGTLNVLLAARDAGVRRVVYASSSSVYGGGPTLPKREDQAPAPISPYAVSKLAGEQYCRVFWQVYGLETVCLRYFNVFGPRQDPLSPYAAVIPRFIRRTLAGEALEVYGDGTQSRDFTHVDNVVEANLLAGTASGAKGDVFNIASGTRFSLIEMIKLLERITGRSVEIRHAPPRRGDILHSMADITMARDHLGYMPTVTFEEGLERTVSAADFSGGGKGSGDFG